jgi:hypothetical protein
MKTKYIMVIIVVAVVGAIAASYAIASVVSDLIMSPFSESVNNLAGEFHTALSYLNITGVAKLTAEETSFVGGWTVVIKAHPGVLASNATLWYWLNADRTYTTVDHNGQTSAGTWCMMSGIMLFATTTDNGVLLTEKQRESYRIWMLQQTTDPNIYNVTKIATILSDGEYVGSGENGEAPLQEVGTVTMSRI